MAKIDLSKLKGVLKGLGALRVYTVLLWPAMIILASAGVMAASLLMGNSFKQKAEKESLPTAKQIKTMLNNPIASGQAEVERQYQEQYMRDANLIETQAIESTQRELLSYDIFPWPKEISPLLFTRFGNRFCQQVESLTVKVNGKDSPSEEELKTSLHKSVGVSRGTLRTTGDDESRIVEELCQARAKSASVYATPAMVSGYNFWEQYKYTDVNDGVRNCWFWQLGYWIIEDVFSTTGSLNAGSNSVYSSPVKRLVRVGFSTPDKLSGDVGKTLQDRPKYVMETKDQLTESCTGRISNDRIDVVHFGIAAVVSTKDVMSFMKELCSAKEHTFAGYNGQEAVRTFKHNQITILESQIKTIDLNSREHQRYRYGPDSVVEIDLVCEYIFNKAGYEAIKPEIANKTYKKGK